MVSLGDLKAGARVKGLQPKAVKTVAQNASALKADDSEFKS